MESSSHRGVEKLVQCLDSVSQSCIQPQLWQKEGFPLPSPAWSSLVVHLIALKWQDGVNIPTFVFSGRCLPPRSCFQRGPAFHCPLGCLSASPTFPPGLRGIIDDPLLGFPRASPHPKRLFWNQVVCFLKLRLAGLYLTKISPSTANEGKYLMFQNLYLYVSRMEYSSKKCQGQCKSLRGEVLGCAQWPSSVTRQGLMWRWTIILSKTAALAWHMSGLGKQQLTILEWSSQGGRISELYALQITRPRSMRESDMKADFNLMKVRGDPDQNGLPFKMDPLLLGWGRGCPEGAWTVGFLSPVLRPRLFLS